MESPSQTLASKIVTRLVKENVISEKSAKNLLTKLAEGKLRPEDWRLPIETANEEMAKK